MKTSIEADLLETLIRRIEKAVREGDELVIQQVHMLLDQDLTARNYFFRNFNEYVRLQDVGAEEKFRVAEDLGELVVPSDYEHSHISDHLHRKRPDMGWSVTSNIFKAGERYRVSLIVQKNKGTTSVAERLNFLQKQGALLFGAHGVMVAIEVFGDRLLKSPYTWFSSLDVPTLLPSKENAQYVLLLRKMFDRFVLEPTLLQRSLSDNVLFFCFKKLE